MSNSNRPLEPVLVAGAAGMVGGAICRALDSLRVAYIPATRAEVDLTDQAAVTDYFATHRPGSAVLAAAKVGGIQANNTYPAEFIAENIAIQNNFICSAHAAGIERLMFLGSSCIYPKLASQPIVEAALLTGPLEPTNEAYAIAKIAGIKTCEAFNRQYKTDYRSMMPTNLYGPGDNFHPENSHVIPALMRRIHQAKEAQAEAVTIWGSGTPRREFLHVDDLARATAHLLSLSKESYWKAIPAGESHVNVGTGIDMSIRELALALQGVIGFDGELSFDASKPDGTPRKVLDVSRIKTLGWQAKVEFEAGLAETYDWFLKNRLAVRQ